MEAKPLRIVLAGIGLTLAICLAAALTQKVRGDDKPGPGASEIKLVPMNFERLGKTVLTNPRAKYVLVDAWATWCATCKENFPHLVEMHKKYGDKGLSVVSLSMDDPTDQKAVADALVFLKESKATFTNILLDEENGAGFEKLNVQAIPAVFLYDSTGKEVQRFTLDDVDNQFSYEQVEEVVRKKLGL